MDKILSTLKEALKYIRSADHLLTMTYPLVGDKKLLINVILSLKEGVVHTINAVLYYEYLYKRVNLYKEPRENLRTFKQKCAKRFGLSEENVHSLLDLLSLAERCSKGQFNLLKGENIIVLSEDMERSIFDERMAKDFVSLAKKFYRAVEKVILRSI